MTEFFIENLFLYFKLNKYFIVKWWNWFADGIIVQCKLHQSGPPEWLRPVQYLCGGGFTGTCITDGLILLWVFYLFNFYHSKQQVLNVYEY